MSRAATLAIADLREPDVLVATGFGVGLLPGAPGTYGSLLGALIWWLAFAQAPVIVQFAGTGLLIVAGTWLLHGLCARRRLGDDPAIVLDEVAGVWVMLACIPSNNVIMATGFLLFRLFDIWKPWPVSWADQRVKGGLGVMLDDILAAVLAVIVVHASLGLAGTVEFSVTP